MKKRIALLMAVFTLFTVIFASCSPKKQTKPGEIIYSEETKSKNRIIQQQAGTNPDTGWQIRKINKDVMLNGENVGGLTEPEVRERLKRYSENINIQARNAKLDPDTWELAVAERDGKSLNIQKTFDALMEAREGKDVSPVIDKIKPDVTSDKLSRNIVEVGRYTTKILDGRDSRMNNISLASDRLDYEKIQSGEEFSFNATLGKRTVRKGYEKAPIIIRTEEGPKKKDDLGGGICQLSSTLYNAADKAGMKITERHSHSKKVMYVPKGRDATVSYGSLDLKFVNTRSYPVMIRVNLSSNRITVKVIENRNST